MDLDYFVGRTPEIKEREARLEKLVNTQALIRIAERTLRDLKEDLGNMHHHSMHFPNIRIKMVDKKEFLERAIPRLKMYFNNQLITLWYE